ncbi:MAG: MFS transporter [Pseudomonadota bacterium]
MDKDTGHPFFYGYIVVAAAFIILTIAWGSNRCFGVFLQPMIEELGWTRAGISGAFTLGMVIMGLAGILMGKATDRFGPRIVSVSCGLLLGIGYMLCAVVKVKWHLYLFYGLIAGAGLSITAPLLSLVARWFVKKRALMTSIIIAGPGLGNMIMPLVFSMFIGTYGWRISYILLGGITLLCILAGAFFLRRDPREMGLSPYGEAQAGQADRPLQTTGLTMKAALGTRQYWLVSCIYFCDFFLMNVVMVHVVIHAQDHGIPLTLAASILSVASGVCIFARIIVGGIADRLGYRRTFLFCLFVAMAGFLLLLFADSLWSLYVFAAIFGFSLWSSGGLIGPIIADLFGLRAHGTIYGSIFVSGAVGGAFGPVVTGFLYDRMGDYRLAFALCIVMNALSIASLLLLKPIRKESPP